MKPISRITGERNPHNDLWNITIQRGDGQPIKYMNQTIDAWRELAEKLDSEKVLDKTG